MTRLLTLIALWAALILTSGGAHGQTAILNDDMSLTLPEVLHNGRPIGYEALLSYDGQSWFLSDLTANDVGLFLGAINHYRINGAPCSAGGLRPLLWDVHLAEAAQVHSEDMNDNGFFDHTGSDGSSPWQRIGRTGFRGQPAGENIAISSGIESAVRQWIHSPGHCRNIMNPQINVVGHGYSGRYFTMLTGRI